MASIRKKTTSTGDTRYEVRVRINGRWTSKTFRRSRDANDWANQTEVDKSRGLAIDPAAGRVTVAEYVEDDIAARTLAATTEATYSDVLKRLIEPTIGSVPLGDLSPDTVRRWYKVTESDFGRAQAAKAYRVLSAACNVAVNDGVIGRNPCAVRGGGQERSVERNVLDAAEALRLADYIDPRLRAFVLLAAFGGLRREELLALRREDLDLGAGTVSVNRAAVFVKGKRIVKAPKSEAGRRTVALPTVAIDGTAHHLDHHAEPGPLGLVFVGEKGGPLSTSTLNKRFREGREAAELTITIHELRHTAGTMAAQLGSTTKEVMVRLGHSSPQAALRYQHAVEDRDRELVKRIDAMIEETQRPLATVEHLPTRRTA